ncbi:MAG TPA: class I SAM-dependent methyltransferase, partial [Thermoanaerobaculia bacterium]|nr:class I SAM-dependent methyltransferase [Thermoanaerobaculia bacterium]
MQGDIAVEDSTGDPREHALRQLRFHVIAFLELERHGLREEELYHRVLAVVHQLCASILTCEQALLTRAEIVDVLAPVRRVHARSPFVARLQQWPRGYPGDFETVEYLCSGVNRAAAGTIERACEAYALSRSIAQQHRNKVQQQAVRILRTMIANPKQTRIASLACGSCPDLRSILDHLPSLAGELWLNDNDDDALQFSARALQPIREHCHIRRGDAIRVARNLPRGAFDLVLAGGLFDYLPTRTGVTLIKIAYGLLNEGGTFFFTNIATRNPYRPLIEYLGDWMLIERSEEE